MTPVPVSVPVSVPVPVHVSVPAWLCPFPITIHLSILSLPMSLSQVHFLCSYLCLCLPCPYPSSSSCPMATQKFHVPLPIRTESSSVRTMPGLGNLKVFTRVSRNGPSSVTLGTSEPPAPPQVSTDSLRLSGISAYVLGLVTTHLPNSVPVSFSFSSCLWLCPTDTPTDTVAATLLERP